MTDVEPEDQSTPRSNWRAGLDVAATILMMVIAAAVTWNFVGNKSAGVAARPTVPVPTEPLSLDAIPTLGSADAKAVMLIFSDFECPFCARFASEIMPPLKRKYVDFGKVLFAFRHLPLAMHKYAPRAAESAECAARQDRFWPMHDALFVPPIRLDEPELEAHAREARLDLAEYADCMKGAASARVAGDSAIARDLGLTGTPSVIIGVAAKGGTVRSTEVIVGVRPLEEFVKAIDRALAK